MTGGPLAGTTVLDCTSVVMGPFATSLLADLGADVVKIEPPDGDIGRRIGPQRGDGLSALALRLLRSKRSVVLDLASAAGRARLDELVATADAVVCTLRPSARERFGLDHASLSAVNPDIVLCTGQAFGARSAQRDEPGYDDTVQALSGMADTYRLRDGVPAFAPSVIADKVCGLHMAIATVSALLARANGNGGQWVDVPMVDTMAAFNLVEHLAGRAFIPPAGDVGWARSLAPDRRPHRARDGWVCVMPYTDTDWHRFLAAADRADLLTAPAFASVATRSSHGDATQAVIAEFVAGRSVGAVLTACRAVGVACAEVRTLDSLLTDEYLVDRGVVQRAEHPDAGSYWNVALPLDFGATPLGDHRPAPRLGADG